MIKNFQLYFISSVFDHDHQKPGPGLDPDSLEMLDPDLGGSICKVVVLDRGAGVLFLTLPLSLKKCIFPFLGGTGLPTLGGIGGRGGNVSITCKEQVQLNFLILN
jgi:hypothetical protein